MSVTKYLPLALIAGGFVALWRLNKGIQASLPTAMPVHGVGDLGFGFKSVMSAAGHATAQVKAVSKVITAPMVAPLRLATAVPLAMGAAIRGRSFAAGAGSMRGQMQHVTKVGSYRPNSNVMLPGRNRPITRSGTPATTTNAAAADVQWTPIPDHYGWSVAPGEGGTMIYKNPAGQMFAAPHGPMTGPMHGLGDLGFGFKSVVKAVSQSVTAPVKAAAAPLRLAVAVPLAVTAGVRTGSFSAATDSLRKSAISPITSITKSTTAFQPKSFQRISGKAMSAPGARVMFGRSKPVTRNGTPATTPAAVVADVQWTPVIGRSGWSTAAGEGGTTVFKGPAGQMFSATASDLSSLGGITGTIDYYLGIGSNTEQPQVSNESGYLPPAPQSPTAPYYGAGPTGGSSGSGQSFTDPGFYAGQSASGGAPAPAPSPSPDPNPQVTQEMAIPETEAAPQTINPLVAGAAAVGAAALLFFGKK
jgi:hypothetical protein